MCIYSSHNHRIIYERVFHIFKQYPLKPRGRGEMRYYIKYNTVLFKNTKHSQTPFHSSTTEGYAITTLKKGLEFSLPASQLKTLCLPV